MLLCITNCKNLRWIWIDSILKLELLGLLNIRRLCSLNRATSKQASDDASRINSDQSGHRK